ncbi:PilW family protein [Pontiella sp.]|uniref:PilW family protein n=1 Tax=Pontiella sp. TaxID=2837462 RepID=UPI0035655A72
MSAPRSKAGFSLIELLVAGLATGILALTVGLILLMPSKSMSVNAEYAELRRDLAVAVRFIAKDVRNAEYSYDGETIVGGTNTLYLPDTEYRAHSIQYTRNPAEGSLTRTAAGASRVLIDQGLTVFNPLEVNSATSGMKGVMLHLEMQSASGVSIVDKTFIHTRDVQ